MKVFTVNEAAEYMRCSRAHIYDLIRLQKLSYLKMGRSTRFLQEDLDHHLLSCRVDTDKAA